MQSPLSPAAYTDEDWFVRERDRVLKPLWQFVGLRVMLNKPNAFITRTLCGIPLVVQNFEGELRAFENLCLHRHNPLQMQAHGVRPLVCSYHGWGYDAGGAPVNIPFEREVFRYPVAERACLRLRRFALETVGNLVFVNLSEQPLPIAEQFSAAFLDSLRESSLAYDDEVMFTTFRTRLNWKLAYENLRDGHHPRYVHARSLFQQVKFGPRLDEAAIAASQQFQAEGARDRAHALQWLRSFSTGGPDEPMVDPVRYTWHDDVERYGNRDWYYNWLAFPNLHIASGSGGHSFIIEHHIPISAGRTDLMVHYVTARKRRSFRSSTAVLHAHMLGAQKVLREDIQVMEDIQARLHAGAPRARLGDYEFTNGAICRWLDDAVEARFGI